MSVRAAVAVGVLLCFGAVLQADTIIYKDGRKLEGTILEETETEYKFKKGAITTNIKKADVLEIKRGEVVAAAPKTEKIAGITIPRAERGKPTGIGEVDIARRKAFEAREALKKLVSSLDRGLGAANETVRDYEALRRKAHEDRQKLERAEARVNELAGMANGMTTDDPQAARVLGEYKTAESSYKRLLAAYNEEIERLNTMEKRFESGVENMGKNSDELAKSFKEADEAWVRLCETERRNKILPVETGAAGASLGAAGSGTPASGTTGEGKSLLSLEGAESRWAGATDLTTGRAAIAGRRIIFEARAGSFDSGKRRLQLWLGEDADPAKWTTECAVTLPDKVEPPAEGAAIFDGCVPATPDEPIVVDRVTTLK
ncbi:MAG: hypothetical protein HYZ53_21415 [Planctomycetes bacterium]|nr:hypothetical protein [Planctomycetota bacterium]